MTHHTAITVLSTTETTWGDLLLLGLALFEGALIDQALGAKTVPRQRWAAAAAAAVLIVAVALMI